MIKKNITFKLWKADEARRKLNDVFVFDLDFAESCSLCLYQRWALQAVKYFALPNCVLQPSLALVVIG